jgi:hypothetical protein
MFFVLGCANSIENFSKRREGFFNPFENLDYDKVVAFDYEGGKFEKEYNIINNGKLASSVHNMKELTLEQSKDFIAFIGDSSTYGAGMASCFYPHLGIVFYKESLVVAHLSICLECNYLRSSIEIPATKVKVNKIGEDFEYPAEGFSKSGRRCLNALCGELSFSHCLDTLDSVFD